MDVVAVRAAVLTLLAPVVVLAALLALLVALVLRASHDNVRADRLTSLERNRAAALAAAQAEARNLTTIGWRSAAVDIDRIMAGSTGQLRQQFAEQRAQFPSLLARQRSDSVGTVLAAGVVSCSPSAGRAQVTVAADAQVSTADSPAPVIKHYRMVMRLLLVHGRWLVSDVAFAGQPQ